MGREIECYFCLAGVYLHGMDVIVVVDVVVVVVGKW